jgi:hypothetical protein
MDQDAAQSAEPARKMIVPPISTGLRPHWSASRPCTGIVTVWVSR